MSAKDDFPYTNAYEQYERIWSTIDDLRPFAAAGRWLIENTNAHDRLTNPYVAAVWHIYEEASGRNPASIDAPVIAP